MAASSTTVDLNVVFAFLFWWVVDCSGICALGVIYRSTKMLQCRQLGNTCRTLNR